MDAEIFEKQFEPYGDGYLYYGGRRYGGRFVSHHEYLQLLANRDRMIPLETWGYLGILVALVAVPMALGWSYTAITVAVLIMHLLWLLYFKFAPTASDRLVRNRPDVTPPRSAALQSRQLRDSIAWNTIALLLLVGALQLASQNFRDEPFVWWTMKICGALIVARYAWIAIRKLLDARARHPSTTGIS